MKSVITKIMHGECSDEFFENDTHYNEILNKLCDCDDYMLKQLHGNDELTAAYRNTTDTLDELCAAESETYFKEGFAFGVMLGLEIAKYDK